MEGSRIGPAQSSERSVADQPGSLSGWSRFAISRPEDLSDAVYGAGLEVTQFSRAPMTGSLAFAMRDGILYSSGFIEGRVALVGPLSTSMITLGVGLKIGPGSRHWLNEVSTGDIGVWLPGDEHDAFYTPGSLYATVTLTLARLEEYAAGAGLVLDARMLGGTGFDVRKVTQHEIAALRGTFARIHHRQDVRSAAAGTIGERLLDVVIAHFGRLPRPRIGRSHPVGPARVVARARDYIHAHLEEPLSIAAIAAAAHASRRTLHRAFHSVLGETPQAYVQNLRLHRIRHRLASNAEVGCTIAMVANQWGISELGRLSGRYRALFGELPSRTLQRAIQQRSFAAPGLAQSA